MEEEQPEETGLEHGEDCPVCPIDEETGLPSCPPED